MRSLILSLFIGAMLPFGAHAVPISSGGSAAVTVSGNVSVYQIFGHSGTTFGPAGDAILITFAAGAGNVFTFSAEGAVGCCGLNNSTAIAPPDGASVGGGGNSNVGGLNGLSDAVGDNQLPLLGVFTTETDPFGGSAPAARVWAAASASGSPSPLLHQVFYVGDGRAGLNNPLGSVLQFTAPDMATRLYLGVADAFNFDGTSGHYQDNPGSFSVTANLLAEPTGAPEPATLVLLALGLAGLTIGRPRPRTISK